MAAPRIGASKPVIDSSVNTVRSSYASTSILGPGSDERTHVNFFSKRRTSLWVAGMERWAKKEVEAHTERTVKGKNKIDRHGMYCLGVISAITLARGKGSPRTSMPKDRDQRQGMADATALLRKVLASNRVPSRDYLELLGDPNRISK